MDIAGAYRDNVPWVKPFERWLKKLGPLGITIALIAVGVLTILLAIFAETDLQLIALVFLLLP
jgi:hypothetical protein